MQEAVGTLRAHDPDWDFGDGSPEVVPKWNLKDTRKFSREVLGKLSSSRQLRVCSGHLHVPPPTGWEPARLLSDLTTHLLTESCLHMALRAPTFSQIQTPPPLAVTSFVCFPVSVLPASGCPQGCAFASGSPPPVLFHVTSPFPSPAWPPTPAP